MTTDNKRPQNLGEAIRKLMSKTPLLRVVVAMGLGIVGFEHLPSVPTGVLYGILAGVVVGMAYIALGKRQRAERAFTAMLWVGFATLGILLCSHYRAEAESGLPDGGWGNEGRGQAVFVARLDDTPHPTPKTYKVPARVEQIAKEGEWHEAGGRIMLYFKQDSCSERLRYGDRVIIRGRPEKPDTSIGEEGFNYRRYLLRKGVGWQCYVASERWLPVADRSEGKTVIGMAKRVQLHLVERIKSCKLSEEQHGMAEALLLGWRDDLEEETQLHFRQAGIVHLLCVSGLHVGIVAWMAGLPFFFFGRLTRHRIIKGTVQIIAIWGFVLVTGMAPSTLRAGVMFTLMRIGYMAQQGQNTMGNLCASALLLLFCNPFLLFDIGFQLSYAAVTGIVAWYKPLVALIKLPYEGVWPKMVAYVWKLICLTTAAQLFTVPLQLYYFHQTASWFMIANLLIVPFAGVLLALVMGLVLIGDVPGIGDAILKVLQNALGFADRLTSWIGSLPYSTIETGDCGIAVVGLLYACLLFTTLYIRCRIKWTLPAGAGCLLIATLLMRADLFLPSAA